MLLAIILFLSAGYVWDCARRDVPPIPEHVSEWISERMRF